MSNPTWRVNVADIDLVFVSYDEPGRQAFFEQTLKVWAGRKYRVENIKGFHSAYSAADDLASSDWFMVVDGDTWLWDVVPEAFELPIHDRPVVYSFGSMNEVNRLCYGNGGPKLWPKGLIKTRTTHERSTEGGSTDFYTTFGYSQIDITFSTTVINQTPLQAIRAGYREAAKMMLTNGKFLPAWKDAISAVPRPNLSRLHIWCSTGADVNNGIWAIYGARLSLLDHWSTKNGNRPDRFSDVGDKGIIHLNDYDDLNPYLLDRISREPDPLQGCAELGNMLESELGFFTPLFDDRMSKWMQGIYMNPPRKGIIS